MYIYTYSITIDKNIVFKNIAKQLTNTTIKNDLILNGSQKQNRKLKVNQAF